LLKSEPTNLKLFAVQKKMCSVSRVAGMIFGLVIVLVGATLVAVGAKVGRGQEISCQVKAMVGTRVQMNNDNCMVYGTITVMLTDEQLIPIENVACKIASLCPNSTSLNSGCDDGYYKTGQPGYCYRAFGILGIEPNKIRFPSLFIVLITFGALMIIAGLMLIVVIGRLLNRTPELKVDDFEFLDRVEAHKLLSGTHYQIP
jgi:hypothetical protein